MPELLTVALSALGGAALMALLVLAFSRLRAPRKAKPTAPIVHTVDPKQPAAPATSERVNTLLATMSHEIRTPLNGLLGMLQLLEGTSMSREQRRTVQMILDSGRVLSQVVDDYLTFYRLESGQGVQIAPGPCELEEVVLQTMMLFQGLARDKDLGFVLVSDAHTPHVVKSDDIRLRQILSNLILNAIKYTDTGEVVVSVEQAGGRTEISVSDTGPGLSAAAQARLFEPFWRPDPTAAQQQGTGLGLTIVRELTEALGGRLTVDSEVGVGTTFTLHFDFEVLIAAAPDPGKFPWHSALVVGGSAGASMALADVLERFGLNVEMVPRARDYRGDKADLAFVFSDDLAPSAPGHVEHLASLRIDVMWLSNPRAHADAPDTHVLIQPFSAETIRHTLSELAAGARRTSTIDRWRHSLAQAYPLSILVAEDDAISAEVIERMLTNLGYTPTLVATGPAAVQAIERGHFDVVLLDLNLPGFGGMEVLRRVKTEGIWRIAMSASVHPELRKQCRDVGFRDFLSKPLTLGTVRNALMRAATRNSGTVDATGGSAARQQIRELFQKSPRAYRDLLASHIAQTDLLCADLETGIQPGGDPETARRAAHTLQAAAASFGCAQVAAHARTLDVEWAELPPERRRELVQRLLKAWRDDERAEVGAELEGLAAHG